MLNMMSLTKVYEEYTVRQLKSVAPKVSGCGKQKILKDSLIIKREVMINVASFERAAPKI
jgi:hypothetical protein